MSRWPAIIALSLVCFASEANVGIGLFYTIETIPGSTPQTTREFSYFPNPIGVRVARRGINSTSSGVQVRFSWPQSGPGEPLLMALDVVTLGDVLVATDANGIAIPPAQFVTVGAGRTTITASVDGDSASTTFDLTSLPGAPVSAQVVSGNDQVAPPGAAFPQPWAIRLLDANGAPVPYAAAVFYSAVAPDTSRPDVTFNGDNRQFAKADANGIATSGPVVASRVEGRGQAVGGAIAGEGTWFSYEIASPPYATSVTLVSAPPDSLEMGAATIAPWIVRVTDGNGAPVAGVAVDFSSPCGGFGADPVRVTSDAVGLASSPLFHVDFAGMCEIRAEARGVPLGRSVDLNIHVFDPASVVIEPSQRFIAVRAGARFGVDVAFTESGAPIYGPPFDVQVISKSHGASATLLAQRTSFDSNVATLEFRANDKQGDYAIVVKRGPVWTGVVVDQRKH